MRVAVRRLRVEDVDTLQALVVENFDAIEPGLTVLDARLLLVVQIELLLDVGVRRELRPRHAEQAPKAPPALGERRLDQHRQHQ